MTQQDSYHYPPPRPDGRHSAKHRGYQQPTHRGRPQQPGFQPQQDQRGHHQDYGWQPAPPPRRKASAGKVVGIVLGVLAACGILFVGCSALFLDAADQAVKEADAALGGAAATGGGPQTARAGQPVTITDALGNTMAKVSVAQVQAVTQEPGDFGLRPERGVYVAARVTVIAERSGVEINPFYFAVVDSAGQRYEPTITTGGFGPQLNATTLAAGQQASGMVVFDVEPAAGHGQVHLTDWLDQAKTIAIWTY